MLKLLMNEKKKRKKYSNFCNSKSFLRSTTQYNICFSNDSNNDGSELVFPFSLFLDDDQTSNLEFEKTKSTILG